MSLPWHRQALRAGVRANFGPGEDWMKQSGAIIVIVVMVAFCVIYASWRIDAGRNRGDGPTIIISESGEKHRVTPRMSEASQKKVLAQAPEFSMEGNDGATYRLSELLQHGPVLLTFIKIGCPCSEAAQPYFNRLQADYPGARILGVIDGQRGPAEVWAKRIKIAYPYLIDPDLKLVREYGVENSAYTVLIAQDGRIAMHWPGYSESVLGELNARLATLTHSATKPIDVADAPTELYTGCPYDLN